MKRLLLYFLTILLWSSCGEKKVIKEIDSKSTNSTSILNQVPKTDKVNIETNVSSIRNYGQRIINNEIQPTDNKETIACLDSISHNDAYTRKFFFQVYRIIATKSDGALSEIIGSYTKTYLQIFPYEALSNFKNLPPHEQKLFIDNLAFEFYASGGDYKADIDNYFNSFYVSCNDCKTETELIGKIKNDLIAIVSQMNE